ncbi:MAG TPA: T9SS type A sorting domain-containing protein, partial [Saprospiraceae bacterium]|nr:T9SS type A sorting domain-containing protein [Saprospiraceae bacterium]
GRTGSNPMTGFGTVGLVIVEDLEGIKSDDQGFMSFKFTEISYLDKNGEYVSIPDQIVTFKLGKKNTPVIANDDNVIVFPNPAMNYVNVASTEGVSINAIRMFTPMGQLVKHVEGSTQLDLSSLPAGLYVLQIETNGGVVTKKFQKVN